MNKSDFVDALLKPLDAFLDSPTQEQVDNLFDQFRSKPQTILERAASIIEETYPYKTFPTKHYFYKAIDEAQVEYNYLTRQTYDEPDCDICSNTGIRLKATVCPVFSRQTKVAVPCDCPAGQRKARAWEKHDSKHRYFRAKPPRQTEEPDPDVPF